MRSAARLFVYSRFFFNDTATTEIYTLSLHDALPICLRVAVETDVLGANAERDRLATRETRAVDQHAQGDRKSTRLNSSHVEISYAVFCLKKKRRMHERSETAPLRFRRSEARRRSDRL